MALSMGLLGAASPAPIFVDYLVIAGGGGGGRGTQGDGGVGGGGNGGGGGGAGGYRTSFNNELSGGQSSSEPSFKITLGSSYSVSIGAAGSGSSSWNVPGGIGSNSTFNAVTSLGGGGGTSWIGHNGAIRIGLPGGSGGGSTGFLVPAATVALGTASQGTNGGRPSPSGSASGGGGGAGVAGEFFSYSQNYGRGGNGGAGIQSSITGTLVTRAGGGGGGSYSGGGSGGFPGGSGGTGGGGGGGGNYTSGGGGGATNTGSGGGGGAGADNQSASGAAGGSGVIFLRYPSTLTITVGAGLVSSTATVGANKVTTITAGTGNVSWAA